MRTFLAIFFAIVPLSHLQSQTSQSAGAAEVQAYIAKAQRGEAGVNPKDQTAARSGDPYAQARVQQRLASNAITAQLSAGTITAKQAEARRLQANSDYQRRLQAIEQEKILAELRKQNEELRRIRQQIDSNQQNQNYRQPGYHRP